MRAILFLVAAIMLLSCNGQSGNTEKLQAQVDSLQKKLNSTYKPGLGEFMLGIQQHHAKLWFAATNKNWSLADFEVHEIGEALDDIKQFCTDRPEIKSIGMIDPGLTSIATAIKQKDEQAFRKGFTQLTNECNACHKDNQHGFNVITIPVGLPIDNQKFTTSN